jgi:hypothetical protein
MDQEAGGDDLITMTHRFYEFIKQTSYVIEDALASVRLNCLKYPVNECTW